MPSTRLGNDVIFCVHLSESMDELSKNRIIQSLDNQLKNTWKIYDSEGCPSGICLHLLGAIELDQNALSYIEEAFNLVDFNVLYFDSTKPKNVSTTKATSILRPIWSPERFLQNYYLGNLIAVNSSRVSRKIDTTIWDVIWNNKIGLIPLAIGTEVSFTDSSQITLHKEWVLNWFAQNRPNIKFSSDELESAKYSELAPNQVSIIIPTRGQLNPRTGSPLVLEAVQSTVSQNLLEIDLELVIVYDDDVDLSYLDDLKEIVDGKIILKLVPYTPPFNFSKKCNEGAQNASGEVLVFLNDDTKWITPDGLVELAGRSTLKQVGAVGAKLYFENELIQHAGIFTLSGNVGHAYFKENNTPHEFGDLTVTHEVVGVTGACFAQRKAIWQEFNGWNEDFDNSYNDVDYCFRIREAGYCILVANQVELYHFESLTRDATLSTSTKAKLTSRWLKYLENDQYFRQYAHSQITKVKSVTVVRKLKRFIRRFL
jgi:glycosyltransferase involved in cell wall biosynthesis